MQFLSSQAGWSSRDTDTNKARGTGAFAPSQGTTTTHCLLWANLVQWPRFAARVSKNLPCQLEVRKEKKRGKKMASFPTCQHACGGPDRSNGTDRLERTLHATEWQQMCPDTRQTRRPRTRDCGQCLARRGQRMRSIQCGPPVLNGGLRPGRDSTTSSSRNGHGTVQARCKAVSSFLQQSKADVLPAASELDEVTLSSSAPARARPYRQATEFQGASVPP